MNVEKKRTKSLLAPQAYLIYLRLSNTHLMVLADYLLQSHTASPRCPRLVRDGQ